MLCSSIIIITFKTRRVSAGLEYIRRVPGDEPLPVLVAGLGLAGGGRQPLHRLPAHAAAERHQAAAAGLQIQLAQGPAALHVISTVVQSKTCT